MLARLQARVEQRPQLGPLVFGLPLAKSIAVRKNALLGAGFFFVAACPAYQGVKAKLFNGFKQRHRLVHIARLARMRQPHGAAGHGVFHAAHDQVSAKLLGAVVAKVGHFMKVVAGIDHQQRVGNLAAAAAVHESFFSAFEQHQRVFAA